MPSEWQSWGNSTSWAQGNAYMEDGWCTECRRRGEGWRNGHSTFYCQACWSKYTAQSTKHWHQQASEDDDHYEGKAYHDEILTADQLAAEGEEGVIAQALCEAEEALCKMQKQTSAAAEEGAAKASQEGDVDESSDSFTPLRSFCTPGPVQSELQPAHIIALVDTSGSMRKIDVWPTEGQSCVSRLAAVKETLSTFYQKQHGRTACSSMTWNASSASYGRRPRTSWASADCPHRFSLISFSHTSKVHFVRQSAADAWGQVSWQSCLNTARDGTHFVTGLAAAEKLLGRPAGTPHLLIFSDGCPADAKQTLLVVQRLLRDSQDLRIHAIGFGDNLDFDLLKQMARDGRGTFTRSDRSIAALHQAFAAVSSSITQTQTVTKTSTFSFKGSSGQSSEEAFRKRRQATFEPSVHFVFDTGSVTFESSRQHWSYDGKSFKNLRDIWKPFIAFWALWFLRSSYNYISARVPSSVQESRAPR